MEVEQPLVESGGVGAGIAGNARNERFVDEWLQDGQYGAKTSSEAGDAAESRNMGWSSESTRSEQSQQSMNAVYADIHTGSRVVLGAFDFDMAANVDVMDAEVVPVEEDDADYLWSSLESFVPVINEYEHMYDQEYLEQEQLPALFESRQNEPAELPGDPMFAENLAAIAAVAAGKDATAAALSDSSLSEMPCKEEPFPPTFQVPAPGSEVSRSTALDMSETPSRAAGSGELGAVARAMEEAHQYALDQLENKMGGRAPEDKQGRKRARVRPEDRESRRIQKNRNSAFVSRIRKREYASCLERGIEHQTLLRDGLSREAEELRAQVAALRELRDEAAAAPSGLVEELAAVTQQKAHDQETAREEGTGGVRTMWESMMHTFAVDPDARKRNVNVGVTSLLIFVCLFGMMIPGMHLSHATHRSGRDSNGAAFSSDVASGNVGAPVTVLGVAREERASDLSMFSEDTSKDCEYPPLVWSTEVPLHADWDFDNATCMPETKMMNVPDRIVDVSDGKWEPVWLGLYSEEQDSFGVRVSDSGKKSATFLSDESGFGDSGLEHHAARDGPAEVTDHYW